MKNYPVSLKITALPFNVYCNYLIQLIVMLLDPLSFLNYCYGTGFLVEYNLICASCGTSTHGYLYLRDIYGRTFLLTRTTSGSLRRCQIPIKIPENAVASVTVVRILRNGTFRPSLTAIWNFKPRLQNLFSS